MIKNIRIKNFKSLRDVNVDLEPVTVLVGRGGTGKSNFVNAIAFLRDCLLLKERAIESWGGATRVWCATAAAPTRDKGTELRFEVRFEVPGRKDDFVYVLCLENHPNNPERLLIGRESLTHGAEHVFVRERDRWEKQPAMSPLPPMQPITLEFASGIPEVGLAYVILTAGVGCYDFGGDVLQTQKKNPKKNRERQTHEAGLLDGASNFLECFENINRNLQNVSAQQEIIAALRALKPALRGLGMALPQRDHVNVSLQFDHTDIVLDLAQESEGFRRFLAHLIALYQVPAKSLVTFEEPEKGLYPGALAALAEQIKAFPETTGGQVILTTHSPLLLDHFQPEQIRVVDMENLETKIGPISQPQMEALREQLETTGELLTVNPAQLASDATA